MNMRAARLVCFFILLVFSAISAFSQTPSPTPEATPVEPEKSKERLELEKNAFKLLDDAIGDANGLKLWENRALVYAAAGDLYWKTDQKRARKLFRDAANEIIAGNQIPKEKSKNYWEDYGYWQDTSPRRAILLLIAAHDADLALELLLETRSPDLQAAINQQNQPKPPPNAPNVPEKKTSAQAVNEQKNKMQIQQEISLEQQFAVKAAEQNPKKAAKLIRDSLSKGFSYAVIQLLAKINEKDEDLGKELLGEIIGKILDTDFAEKEDARSVASIFLQQAFNPQTYKSRDEKFKPLKLEDKDLKAIAAKLADYFIGKTDLRSYWSFSEILPALEKYAPEKSPQLKQRADAFKKLIPEEDRGWQEVRKLINDPNSKPEQLIDEADKYAGYEKFELYRSAVDKALEAGTGDKIRDLLRGEPSGKQRDDALSYIDTKLSEKAIKDDKLEDAQSLVAKTESNSSKVRILVDLALGFHKKNTKEARETAVDLMTKARALVGDAPESREEVGDILKVASGYAVVEPSRAFLYLPPLVEMSNDLMMAYSLLAKYSKQEAFFKKGEMLYTQTVGNSGASYMRYGKELGLLAAADFGRAKGLIEQFRRDDVRVLVKVLTAQSIFKEKIGFDGMNTYSYDDD
jgi:hypothetical protein